MKFGGWQHPPFLILRNFLEMVRMLKKNLVFIIPVAIILGAGAYYAYNNLSKVDDSKNQVSALDTSVVNNVEPLVTNAVNEIAPPPLELTTSDAFKMAFGLNTPSQNTMLNDMKYSVGKLVDVGDEKVLVSIGSGDLPHANGGIVRMDYFKPNNDVFEYQPKLNKTVESGSFGQIGDWGVNYKLGTNPVVFIEGGGTWQGTTCSFTTLVELTPNGANEVFNALTSFSNDGAVESGGDNLEGKITNIQKGKSFDVVYTGTKNITVHYEKHGGKYETATDVDSVIGGC